MEKLYAHVILALHLPFTYTYLVDQNLKSQIQIGQRVVVQLKNRIYSAIVADLEQKNTNTHFGDVKYVLDIIDKEPILTKQQIKFFKWIADYYICYISDVITAALPACFRLKSETIVAVSPYFSADISDLNTEELQIFNVVNEKGKLSVDDLSKLVDKSAKHCMKIINELIEKDVLITDEELNERYKPKTETYISLNEIYKEEGELKKLLDLLDKNKNTARQTEVILKYLSVLNGKNAVKKSELELLGCKNATMNTLLKKNIFVKQSVEISRLDYRDKILSTEDIFLNEQQQNVYDKIINSWDIPISLLYGVTGSGKTEIYIKLIEYVFNNRGGQILYLLPEIAITAQLLKRLEKYFGSQIVAYNSKFSTFQRAEVWKRVLKEDNLIVIGSRSATLLPFTKLELVIIDEEHDISYKQNEPIPHYNGRDCALYLAKLTSAKTILGSATPNIETYKLACEGKYQLLELKKQYYDLPLPKIELIDMKQAVKEQNIYGIFSKQLFDAINQALNDKKQVIIFQNRRGYAPHIECNVCGYVPKCINCDVSLVLHKDKQDLECHYCGYHTQTVAYCPQCHSHSMRFVGVGTQKIEEELQTYFPNARIQRMDLDSTRTKDAYNNIINDFALHKIDILCGTQIISKGLDFENVSLVGVLGADMMLHYPDFRSYERTFQILTQVSGRAGRKNKEGKVLIQTFEPQHSVMQDVMNRNYINMYQTQLNERKMMNFPPYCRMIKLTLQHKDKDFIAKKSKEYAINLQKIFGSRLLGPQTPLIARIKNLYAMEIWLKIDKNISYYNAKQLLRQYNEQFLVQKTNSQIRISIDVDPV